ncbi:MAG: hypothetical protein M3410_15065 [Acidobacteriota bacterium]|nr:hypothetical protein [Acidobacteriota bacterium]
MRTRRRLLKGSKSARKETEAQLRREFLAAVSKLWPVAGGSLSWRKNSCVREQCAACESGAGHPGYGLWGRSGAQRFGLYVPAELAPELEQALENGRALQQLVLEMGVRYTGARKRERNERLSRRKKA